MGVIFCNAAKSFDIPIAPLDCFQTHHRRSPEAGDCQGVEAAWALSSCELANLEEEHFWVDIGISGGRYQRLKEGIADNILKY